MHGSRGEIIKKNCVADFQLLREYFRNRRDIGTIMPDSGHCVDALLSSVPFGTARVIIEFGAASGAVTREIVKRKKPSTIFISFEKNRRLYRETKERVSGENVFIVNEDVFDCARVLKELFGGEMPRADCIVSTLPCSSMDFSGLLKKAVAPVLSSGGHFIQYMHLLSLFKLFNPVKILQEYFEILRTDFVLFNVPPVLIYRCRPARQPSL